MNIKITYNWLLEYLETDAGPFDIQKYLSLCGPSVESVERAGPDYVFDIEITSNRIDTASVYGIARECQAILPQFGKKARLRINPDKKYVFRFLEKPKTILPLTVAINDPYLSHRVSAIVLSEITIGQSPKFIKERLEACGERSINNVIDISNYLRLALGQPVHIFDYDKIASHKMTILKSVKGETIKTLDGKTIALPGDDIIIKDGKGQIIDLVGIMGGQNTEVTAQTKNIVLFVPSCNKEMIRKTAMRTGQRTQSVSYFEKSLSPRKIESVLVYGVDLLSRYADAVTASRITDLYPKKVSAKKITIAVNKINQYIGVEIPQRKIIAILEKLGFTVTIAGALLSIMIPYERSDDIVIEEDIIEEVARIFGYHNIPAQLQEIAVVAPPADIEKLLLLEGKIKYLLKHLGSHEIYNYSMISELQIKLLDLKLQDYLKISNPISQEIEYLRADLSPSLIKNAKDNQGKIKSVTFFEIANTYHEHKGELPDEIRRLGLITNSSFLDLKGMVEQLGRELNLSLIFTPNRKIPYLSDTIQVAIETVDKFPLGWLGQLSPVYAQKHGLKQDTFIAQLELFKLYQVARQITTYVPINPFATVKLDLTIAAETSRNYQQTISKIQANAEHLSRIEFLGQFQGKINLRLYFENKEKNITEAEALLELEKVIKSLK